jgi:Tfp pilus assembly protein PilF
MGVIEMKSNHPAEAIAYWQRATAADPKLYDAMYNLAIVAARTGKNDVARDALRRFIDTAPPQRYADDIATARALLAQLQQ